MSSIEENVSEFETEVEMNFDADECWYAVVHCHGEQPASEVYDTINEVAPELLGKVHGRQCIETGAEQLVFCYGDGNQINDWQLADSSVLLPDRQSDDDPIIELLTSELTNTRMEEAQDWEHVYGVPLESISPLNWEEINLLIECLGRVYDLHFPDADQEAEEISEEVEYTIPDEPDEDAPVTANWLFENFRETIVSLQATDQQRVNLFQPILVTLLCDGFSDASCRREFLKWLTKFISRFE